MCLTTVKCCRIVPVDMGQLLEPYLSYILLAQENIQIKTLCLRIDAERIKSILRGCIRSKNEQGSSTTTA
jgi:hypothetical protein